MLSFAAVGGRSRDDLERLRQLRGAERNLPLRLIELANYGRSAVEFDRDERLIWRQLQRAVGEAVWCENQASRDSLSAEVVGDDGSIGEANLRRELRERLVADWRLGMDR